MINERKCGVLLPVSSLPSRYGIGCFSKSAYEFVDQLKEAGKNRAYQKVMDAVASFDIANAQLDAVFKELAQEEME